MEHIVTPNCVYWLWSCDACFRVDSLATSDFVTILKPVSCEANSCFQLSNN
jgi:hypothetical protein